MAVARKRHAGNAPILKRGTLVIVTNLGGVRSPHEFGVVIDSTSGNNWEVSTGEGVFIYSDIWIRPILETDGTILTAIPAWRKYMKPALFALAEMLNFKGTTE